MLEIKQFLKELSQTIKNGEEERYYITYTDSSRMKQRYLKTVLIKLDRDNYEIAKETLDYIEKLEKRIDKAIISLGIDISMIKASPNMPKDAIIQRLEIILDKLKGKEQ
jgi:hypothetical protein